MTSRTRIAVVLLLLAASCAFAWPAQAADDRPSFNNSYAAPFGHRPSARVENAVRFGYFTRQGTVEGVDKPVHGGIFALNLAMEDIFGFELKTIWERQVEQVTFQNGSCTEGSQDCLTEDSYYSGSEVTIGLVPQYKFLNLDWVWGAVALEVLFPLQAGINDASFYEINPGLQFYFNTGDWFGIELDVAMLMTVMDPKSTDDVAKTSAGYDDATKLVAGVNARANFLLKIIGTHFINLQVEDSIYFHNVEGQRAEQVAKLISHIEDPSVPQDYLDMHYYSNHRLDVGLGYRVILDFFEGGVYGFAGVTDRDKRQNWGVNVEGSFTF